VDQISVAGRTAEAWCADPLLPAGVGQWIGRASGQDQSFRHLEGREPGVEMVEPAPDHGRFDPAGLGAKTLMVPVAPFQGAVDEEPEAGLGTVFRVCIQLRGCSNVNAVTPLGTCPFALLGDEAEFAVFDGPHKLAADGEHGHGRHIQTAPVSRPAPV
jgi:hypothetical protein